MDEKIWYTNFINKFVTSIYPMNQNCNFEELRNICLNLAQSLFFGKVKKALQKIHPNIDCGYLINTFATDIYNKLILLRYKD